MPKVLPKVGLLFYHKHLFDPSKMPARLPMLFKVTRIAQGVIYYRPVIIRSSGRVDLGMAYYATPEYWTKIFLKEKK